MRNHLSGLPAIAMLAGPILLGGCVNGRGLAPNQQVAIVTYPVGAKATSNYRQSCTTPCKLRLPTDNGGTIWVAKDGYETETVSIGSHVDATSAALSAASFTDPLDAALEAASGAILGVGMVKTLDDRHVELTLVPAGTLQPAASASAAPIDSAAPVASASVDTGDIPPVLRLSQEEIDRAQASPRADEARPDPN